MPKRPSNWHRLYEQLQTLLDVSGPAIHSRASKWRRFVHFWVLVGVSFNRNRCFVHASALAYATLLALIPMLAVVISITSSILREQGEDRINDFISKLATSMTPPAPMETFHDPFFDFEYLDEDSQALGSQPGVPESATSPAKAMDDQAASANEEQSAEPAAPAKKETSEAQRAAAQYIHTFIQNTRSGALGVTGSVVLVFVAISMLSRIEATFNDIWGVARGRSWFMRIVLYWWVLTLVPVLLVVALGLATGPQFEATQRFLAALPFIGNFLVTFGLQLLPVAVLCLTFATFYLLVPNTKVHWGAALVGGLVGAALFHGNNMISVLYVSRVVSNSKIYGSLGLVPVFMIGLYFSWLILLFGAQVAYAFQNRAIYLEEKQVETINQRGREFIALRLMTMVAQRYLRAEPPCKVVEMAEEIGVPTRLIQQIMQTLAAARLSVETAGAEPAYLPARPVGQITCYDVLEAMRVPHGAELGTREEPTRLQVYGEFQKIQEAERQTAAAVTMLDLANRATAQPRVERGELKALT